MQVDWDNNLVGEAFRRAAAAAAAVAPHKVASVTGTGDHLITLSEYNITIHTQDTFIF